MNDILLPSEMEHLKDRLRIFKGLPLLSASAVYLEYLTLIVFGRHVEHLTDLPLPSLAKHPKDLPLRSVVAVHRSDDQSRAIA